MEEGIGLYKWQSSLCDNQYKLESLWEDVFALVLILIFHHCKTSLFGHSMDRANPLIIRYVIDYPIF